MAHDVFVSHSAKDKVASDALVACLERSGLRCWVAPRDILPGASWASAILAAISESAAMIVVFSNNANASHHIQREVERAITQGIPVIPLRIEDVMPRGDLEYFLSSAHWMDAITPPIERHFENLAAQVRRLLGRPEVPAAAPLAVSPQPPVALPPAPVSAATSPPVAPAPAPSFRARSLILPVVLAIVIVAFAVDIAVHLFNRAPATQPAAVVPPPAKTEPMLSQVSNLPKPDPSLVNLTSRPASIPPLRLPATVAAVSSTAGSQSVPIAHPALLAVHQIFQLSNGRIYLSLTAKAPGSTNLNYILCINNPEAAPAYTVFDSASDAFFNPADLTEFPHGSAAATYQVLSDAYLVDASDHGHELVPQGLSLREFSAAGPAFALQPDGGLLVAGQELDSLTKHEIVAIAKYRRNGSPDDSFGADTPGFITTNLAKVCSDADRAAFDRRSRLVVLGRQGDAPRIVWIGNDGKVLASAPLPIASAKDELAIGPASDDGIMLLLRRQNRYVPFHATLLPDAGAATFHIDLAEQKPLTFPDPNFAPGAAAFLSNQGCLVAGNTFVDSSPQIFCFSPNGSLDTSLAPGGVIQLPPAPGRFVLHGLDADSQGRLRIFASDLDHARPAIEILRLAPDHTLDSSFATAGRRELCTGPGLEYTSHLFAPDGSLFILCTSAATTPAGAVIHLTADGNFDDTFGDRGISASFSCEPAAFHIDSHGRILVCGSQTSSTMLGQNRNPCVVRLDARGAIDTRFGDNGYFRQSLQTTDLKGQSAFLDLKPALDDSLMLLGYASNRTGFLDGLGGAAQQNLLLRLSPEGTLDTSLGQDGFIPVDSHAAAFSDLSAPLVLTSTDRSDGENATVWVFVEELDAAYKVSRSASYDARAIKVLPNGALALALIGRDHNPAALHVQPLLDGVGPPPLEPDYTVLPSQHLTPSDQSGAIEIISPEAAIYAQPHGPDLQLFDFQRKPAR